jgi:CRP-like cAMP-binding protein
LYSLSRSDLDQVLEIYPEMADNLEKIAEKRLEADLVRIAEIAKKADRAQNGRRSSLI